MSCLYPAFRGFDRKKLRFFYGKDLDTFESDKVKITKSLERSKRLNRPISYFVTKWSYTFGMYQADLIEMFCSPTINFHNLGLGYIAPLDDKLLDAFDEIDDSSLTEDEFHQIFLAFLCNSFTDSFSFDNTTPEEIRREVKYIKGNRYGFTKKESKTYFNDRIKEKYPLIYEKIYDAIIDNFYRQEGGDYFLNLETVKIVLTDEDKLWVRCKTCGQIHPFAIDGTCSICDRPTISKS